MAKYTFTLFASNIVIVFDEHSKPTHSSDKTDLGTKKMSKLYRPWEDIFYCKEFFCKGSVSDILDNHLSAGNLLNYVRQPPLNFLTQYI